MATPSVTIAASDINTELGRASTTSLNMNERIVRQLGDSVTNNSMTPATGSFSYDELRNKSRIRTQTLSSGTRTQRTTGVENISWNLATFARWDITSYSSWINDYGGNITTDSLDVQFDTTSALKADPNNWTITTSGATYGIRLTISGTSKNLSTGSRLLVGFFNRGGINSSWFPPDRPINYSYTTAHSIANFSTTETAFSISSEIVAENLDNSLQGPDAVPWTLSRLKTYLTNNYFSVTCDAIPWASTGSLFNITSMSITVQTSIS